MKYQKRLPMPVLMYIPVQTAWLDNNACADRTAKTTEYIIDLLDYYPSKNELIIKTKKEYCSHNGLDAIIQMSYLQWKNNIIHFGTTLLTPRIGRLHLNQNQSVKRS